jgi:uncharacterized protein YjbJ (UPF0337 family)
MGVASANTCRLPSTLTTTTGGWVVNTQQLQGDWKQVSGRVHKQWAKLTDDDLAEIEGRTEQLVGKIQERYGVARERAESQVQDFLDRESA